MPSARSLTERLRRLAPEALAFGVIGAANAALYMAITSWRCRSARSRRASSPPSSPPRWRTSPTATGPTATTPDGARAGSTRCSSASTWSAWSSSPVRWPSPSTASASTRRPQDAVHGRHAGRGIAVATIFRFWAYRTFVFLKPPVDGHEAAIAELDIAAGLAELSAEPDDDLDAELAELEPAEKRRPALTPPPGRARAAPARSRRPRRRRRAAHGRSRSARTAASAPRGPAAPTPAPRPGPRSSRSAACRSRTSGPAATGSSRGR